ncbi:60S ribosomal protein L7a [Capsaspora owczarzaki ATCC 30864]|uniref:60S ribosomal protein L7a n=1 Tax=Capsaspora owczarzaki (strain ATCC 30864) TaxID=595528 RepID=UPI0001FE4052|nr:60S ribosomal protein L7a [Capsaspora owczarzaki ATCC 30864]|eukprot:XP_004363841.1 60S ribosomal protein L7a [Capsaspora owczarzaki ATCC 30864]
MSHTLALCGFFAFNPDQVKDTKKKVAAAPLGSKKVAEKKAGNPLIQKRTRNFGIGGDVQPKRDMGRFVRWPRYVRLQRQRAVLYERLKVPPSINQFTKCLDKNNATELFRLLSKYRPETSAQKTERLKAEAVAKVDAKKRDPTKKPLLVKYGLNHITGLVEKKAAQLVVIAHDVDPVELVLWLPALCRKMDIPYCIVKSKARLGALVHLKTATAVAITGVKNEDKPQFAKLLESIRANYNEKHAEIRRSWGGGVLGQKSRNRTAKLEKIKAKEAAAKLG